MVSPDDPGPRVDRPATRREQILPARLAVGLGVFHGQGVWQVHPAEAVAEVGVVERVDVLDLAAERIDQ